MFELVHNIYLLLMDKAPVDPPSRNRPARACYRLFTSGVCPIHACSRSRITLGPRNNTVTLRSTSGLPRPVKTQRERFASAAVCTANRVEGGLDISTNFLWGGDVGTLGDLSLMSMALSVCFNVFLF